MLYNQRARLVDQLARVVCFICAILLIAVIVAIFVFIGSKSLRVFSEGGNFKTFFTTDNLRGRWTYSRFNSHYSGFDHYCDPAGLADGCFLYRDGSKVAGACLAAFNRNFYWYSLRCHWLSWAGGAGSFSLKAGDSLCEILGHSRGHRWLWLGRSDPGTGGYGFADCVKRCH